MVKESNISLRVPGELREEVEQLAARMDRSMSWVMLQGIREYVLRANGQQAITHEVERLLAPLGVNPVKAIEALSARKIAKRK